MRTDSETSSKENKHAVTEKDIKTILSFIESIQFGSVSIIIQNGKVIQIEKNEKVRLN